MTNAIYRAPWRYAGLALGLCACLFWGGCTPEASNWAPLRFAETVDSQPPPSPPPPLYVPIETDWEAIGGKAGLITRGLHFLGKEKQSGLARDFEVDASRYNTLIVEAASAQDMALRFAWVSDYSPLGLADEAYPWVEAPIFASDEPQVYVYHLNAEDNASWMGKIRRIILEPGKSDVGLTIGSVAFTYKPRTGPYHLTLGDVTLEAFHGTQPPWTLTVPPEAVLELHMGMLKRAWTGTLKGNVRFRVTIEDGKNPRALLISRHFSPNQAPQQREWVRGEADLGAYAGQTVTLHLDVDPRGLPVGDYAYWGNPTIYSRKPAPRAVPVVLISCDTLRADHLGCYGYGKETSPYLDRFAAEEAALFENAITPETWTLPAHMTMFTGLSPTNHKTDAFTNLSKSVPTLPAFLREAGYLNAFFTGNYWWFLPSRGFCRATDFYDVPGEGQGFRHIYNTRDQAQEWLEAHPEGNWFLFFHNYDIHSKWGKAGYDLPYDPGDLEFRVFSKPLYNVKVFDAPEKRKFKATDLLFAQLRDEFEFSETEHELLGMLYDDCVRMVDNALHEFFAYLKERGRYEDTLIIITSDHGETLNERGHYAHNTVYEEVCRVPLLVKFPRGEFAGRRFSPQVESADIFATILDVAGIAPPESMDGQSLRALLQDKAEPRERIHIYRNRQYATRTNNWKYIWEQDPEEVKHLLFDLVQDPGETESRANEATDLLDELHADTRSYYDFDTSGWHVQARLPEDGKPVEVWISSDTRLVTCQRIRARDCLEAVPVHEDRTNAIWLGSGDSGHVFARPASTSARIRVALRREEFFHVGIGRKRAEPYRSFTRVIDPADGPFEKPDIPEAVDKPIVYIWYEPPAAEQEAAEVPSEEMRENLEALGYLGASDPETIRQPGR